MRSLAKDTAVCLGEAVESFHFDEKTRHVSLRFDNGRRVLARSAFITVPSLQLKKIAGIPQSVVNVAESSLMWVPAFKVFLSWRSPWWIKDFCLTGGHSITTLRTRMVYYWDDSTLLIYDAGSNGGASALATLHQQRGLQAVVDAVVHDLSLAHYGEPGRVPQPEDVHVKAWSLAVSLWKKDVDIPKVRAEIMQPLGPKIPVWCASSCSSDTQGWMEGALEASDAALESFCAQRIWKPKARLAGA